MPWDLLNRGSRCGCLSSLGSPNRFPPGGFLCAVTADLQIPTCGTQPGPFRALRPSMRSPLWIWAEGFMSPLGSS